MTCAPGPGWARVHPLWLKFGWWEAWGLLPPHHPAGSFCSSGFALCLQRHLSGAVALLCFCSCFASIVLCLVFLCFALLALLCFSLLNLCLFRELASEPMLVWAARWARPGPGPDPGTQARAAILITLLVGAEFNVGRLSYGPRQDL